jgi:hypothetical protein
MRLRAADDRNSAQASPTYGGGAAQPAYNREGHRNGRSEWRTKRSFRALPETSKIFHEKLPIFFPDNAEKQRVTRKWLEVYWTSDYESAALTI